MGTNGRNNKNPKNIGTPGINPDSTPEIIPKNIVNINSIMLFQVIRWRY